MTNECLVGFARVVVQVQWDVNLAVASEEWINECGWLEIFQEHITQIAGCHQNPVAVSSLFSLCWHLERLTISL